MRILLGDEFTPKYRVYKRNCETALVVSRLLETFTTWSGAKREAIEPGSVDAKLFGFEGLVIRDKDYYQYAVNYLKMTASLENFNKVVAVCLLFGKDDIHGENWGIVDVNRKKYAATVDHGEGLKKGFDFYDIIDEHQHRKEQFLTKEFIDSCLEVVRDYENNKEVLKSVMSECINNLMLANIDDVPSLSEAMEILEYNKDRLIDLAFQLEAEMAILAGNPDLLRHALMGLSEAYLPEREDVCIPSQLVGMQSCNDGTIETAHAFVNIYGEIHRSDDSVNNFRVLIKVRKWNDCDLIDSIKYDDFGFAKIKFSQHFDGVKQMTDKGVMLESCVQR